MKTTKTAASRGLVFVLIERGAGRGASRFEMTCGGIGSPRSGRRLLDYRTMYFAMPSPLGHVPFLTRTAYLVVVATTAPLHAAAAVGKKTPVQADPAQTPAPSLAQA